MNPEHVAPVSNKQIVHRLYEELLNGRKLLDLDQVIADEFIGSNQLRGVNGFKEGIAALMDAFPDITWTIDRIVEENDTVMVMWHWNGTHQHVYLNIAATGNSVINYGTGVFTIRKKKIIASQVFPDRLGFLQQLNVMPKD